LQYIEEDAEGQDSSSDDDEEVCDAVPIDSLKIDQVCL
jgi:RIO kinase 2